MATTFDYASNKLLGVSAKDLCLLATEPSAVKDLSLHVTSRRYLFTVSIKTETFNSNTRLNTTLVDLEELPYAAESTKLLEEISTLTTQTHPVARRL